MSPLRIKRSSIAVGIALLIVFVRSLPDSAPAKVAMLLLGLGYIAGLWGAVRISSARKRCLLFALLYGASLLYWVTVDEQTKLLLTLQGFLICYIALLLPGRPAIMLGGGIVLFTFLLLVLYEKQPWEQLLRQDFFIYAGFFAMFRMLRSRRLREEEQRRHTEELTAMHAELAETHTRLQQAHEELELATIQSLRYAVLEERSRIARDIHDSVGHRLTSVIWQLQALPYVLKTDETQAQQIADTVLDVTRDCLEEVRSVVHHMGEDEAGTGIASLGSLVQQAAASSGLEIELNMDGQAALEDWPPEIAVVLYRSLQEALTNTLRHAGAQRVDISVTHSGYEVALHYRDDGMLLPGAALQEGFGLSGIRTRCQDAGGNCIIGVREPHGMAIDIRLPLAAGKEE